MATGIIMYHYIVKYTIIYNIMILNSPYLLKVNLHIINLYKFIGIKIIIIIIKQDWFYVSLTNGEPRAVSFYVGFRNL